MELFETLHTCYGQNEAVLMAFGGARIILTDLRPFELSHFRQHFALWGMDFV